MKPKWRKWVPILTAADFENCCLSEMVERVCVEAIRKGWVL